MPIVFNAFLSIFPVKIEFIDNLVEQFFFDRHLLFSREKAHISVSVFDKEGPSMVSDIIHSKPLLGICVQDSSYYVFALARKELGKSVLRTHDFLVQIWCFWVLEWQITANHGVEYHTAAPNISLETVVSLAGDHLRGCVAGRATSCLQCCPWLIHVAETEVYDLQSQIVI